MKNSNGTTENQTFEEFMDMANDEFATDTDYQGGLEETQKIDAEQAAMAGDGFEEWLNSEDPENEETEQESILNDDKKLSAWLDVPLQMVGGARDAVQAVWDLEIALMGKLNVPIMFPQEDENGNFSLESTPMKEAMEKGFKGPTLPEVPEADTTVGAITRPVSQFLLPFGMISKGARGAQIAGLTGKATPFIAGAATDFAAFDGHEQRLSNVLKDLGAENILVDYLAADDDDTEMEGRLKNTLEGGMLGVAADAVFRAAKFVKSGHKAKKIISETKEAAVVRTDKMRGVVKQIKENKKIAKLKEEVVVFKKETLPPRVNKEEIPIAVQEKMANTLGTTVEEVQKGDIFQKVRQMGVQDELNKVTNLQEEQFSSLKEALPDYMARLDIGDTSAADEFLANELHAFLEMDGAAKDAFQDVARVLGRRGKSEAVTSANKLSAVLQNANELTKEQVVRAFSGIVDKAGEVDVLVKNLSKDTTAGKVNKVISEYYINALLSSPKTLLVDTWSNPLWNTYLAAERLPAAVVGKIRQGFFQRGSVTDAVQFNEARVMLQSFTDSVTDSLRFIGKAYRSNAIDPEKAVQPRRFQQVKDTIKDVKVGANKLRIDTQTRFDVPQAQRAIKADTFGVERDTTLGRIIDTTGAIVNSPTSFMQAKDDVAKALLYRGEVQALAHRRAAMEGLSGAAYQARIKELVDVPLTNAGLDAQNMTASRIMQFNKALAGDDTELISSSIARAARKAAQEGTFTQELGPVAKAAQTFFNELPGGKFIVPFIKTPVNLIKIFAERTPLAPLSKNIRADIAAGGARADMALGRIAMGSGVMAFSYMLATNGRLTGEGPKDSAERKALLRTGWRPRSIKVGEKYLEVGRFDPIASFLLFPANLVDMNDQLHNDVTGDLEKDMSDYVALNLLAGANMFLSKSFTASIGELMDAITSEDENKAQRLLNFYGSAFVVPNAVSFVANEIDPTLKEAGSLWEAIKNKAGTGDVPRRNIFGEPVKRDPQTMGYMIPMSYSQIGTDKLSQDLVAAGAYIRMPPRRIEGVELSVQQYDRLMEIMGELKVRERLQTFVDGPAWKVLDDTNRTGVEGAQGLTKSGMASRLYSEFVKAARGRLLNEDAELSNRVKDYQTKLQSAPKASPLSQRVLQSQGITTDNKGNPVTFNPSGGE